MRKVDTSNTKKENNITETNYTGMNITDHMEENKLCSRIRMKTTILVFVAYF